jgi:replication factor A1
MGEARGGVWIMDEKLQPHVEDIARALGGKADKKEIGEELENYIKVYRVGIEDAKRSIVKKFGGAPVSFSAGVEKKLSELEGNENNVNILCRIVNTNRKEIDSNGSSKEIFYGILGDDTTTVPFTAWETENLSLAQGDVIRVENAYTKEWMGRVQVYFGTRAIITQEKKDAVPYPKKPMRKVEELEEGMRNTHVVARVLSIEEREVEVSGEKKTVFSGVIGDASGRIRFSAWYDFALKEDEVIEIDGGYIRSWRGIPQLNFDDRASVERSDEALPSIEDIMKVGKSQVGDLEGGVDIMIEGVLIDVKEGSGVIYRCPECNRVAKKGACSIHGEVDARPDLRIKGILDDGTGALTAIFGRDRTEELLKKDLEQCLEETRASPNHDIIKDELFKLLTGQPMRLRGNVLKDDFGLTMITDSAEFIRVNLTEEARALLREVES